MRNLFPRLLVLLAALYAWSALADKLNSPKIFKIGDKVKVCSCKKDCGKDWVSIGYPLAEMRPIRGCGHRGVVVDTDRACAPYELHLDSCDPWKYEVRIDDLPESDPRDVIKYYAYQLGKKAPIPHNRMVDFACDRKKRKCSVEK